MTRTSGPMMALLRVQVPDEVDAGLVEAEVTRAICGAKKPMSVEVIAVPDSPTVPSAGRDGRRPHRFVAMLSTANVLEHEVLAADAENALRKAFRRRFGIDCSARVSASLTGSELDAGWRSLCGTPTGCWAGVDIVEA